MKYFRDEKMAGMTVRNYTLTKIIACASGMLLAFLTPKEDRKVVGGVAIVALILASLFALSEMITCTFSIGFGREEDCECGCECDCENDCHCGCHDEIFQEEM